MNKVSILTWLVVVLAILNLVLLGFTMMGKKGHHPKDRSKEKADAFIQKRFDFDDQQMKVFKASKQSHESSLSILKPKLSALSTSYYQLENNAKVEKDSLLNEMLTTSQQIFKANDLHFQEIRDVCETHQLEEMDKFINALVEGKIKQKRRR